MTRTPPFTPLAEEYESAPGLYLKTGTRHNATFTLTGQNFGGTAIVGAWTLTYGANETSTNPGAIQLQAYNPSQQSYSSIPSNTNMGSVTASYTDTLLRVFGVTPGDPVTLTVSFTPAGTTQHVKDLVTIRPLTVDVALPSVSEADEESPGLSMPVNEDVDEGNVINGDMVQDNEPNGTSHPHSPRYQR